jgi:hypothetical protein
MLSIDIVASRGKLFQKNVPGESIQEPGIKNVKLVQ